MEVFNGTREECEEYVFAHSQDNMSIKDDFISDCEEEYCFVEVVL